MFCQCRGEKPFIAVFSAKEKNHRNILRQNGTPSTRTCKLPAGLRVRNSGLRFSPLNILMVTDFPKLDAEFLKHPSCADRSRWGEL